VEETMNRIAAIVLLLAATAVAQTAKPALQTTQTPAPKITTGRIPAFKACTAPDCIALFPASTMTVGSPVELLNHNSKLTVIIKFKETIDVDSQTGRVVKLSDEEYARLQKLRQAVADEEKKIAVAHGVDTEGDLYPCGKPSKDYTNLWESGIACEMPVGWNYKYPDRWQFRGQFLLINVPRKETK